MTIKEPIEEENIHSPGEGDGDNETREFPDPFYCPLTKQLLKTPVVSPDGATYEEAAIIETGDVPADKLYPNRALETIIGETTSTSGTSMRAGLLRMQKSLRQSLTQIAEKSAMPSRQYRALSDAYYCTITFGVMHDPVIDPQGNTFERVAIEGWIRANGTSPITRAELSIDQLYPNCSIKELLELEKNRTDESMHPSIRKWKDEKPPVAIDVETGGETGGDSHTNTNNFPTTETELERRRRQQNQAACTVVGLLLFIALAVLSVLYGGLFIAIAVVLLIVFSRRHNRGNLS